MKKTGNKYIDNARVWGKQRTFNERTLALLEMIKLAKKHFPETVALIHKELANERNKIMIDNLRRRRMSIIGR